MGEYKAVGYIPITVPDEPVVPTAIPPLVKDPVELVCVPFPEDPTPPPVVYPDVEFTLLPVPAI